MYSLEDLEEAKRNFEYWSDLWAKENCDPESNKYTPEAKKASQHLSNVEEYLKKNGTIPWTEEDLAQEYLNREYPRAQSRDVEIYSGARYRKHFYPKKRSKTGKTVKEWGSEWVKLGSQPN